MNLVYGVKDKPKFGQLLVFAFQQVLAILAATIAVPAIINGNADLLKLYPDGVGMSQVGARAFAIEGRSYDWILAHYYQGTKLTVLTKEMIG